MLQMATSLIHFVALLLCCYWNCGSAIMQNGVFRANMNDYAKYNVRHSNIHSKTPPYQTFFFDSPLDHFDFTENRKFKLRFLFSGQHFNKKQEQQQEDRKKAIAAPLLFYTGNEGNVELFVNNSGLLFDLAPKLGAAVVFAEHRYYGLSLPFGNDSYSNASTLAYFTVAQVLADYASLIQWLLSDFLPRDTPVVAFGGSYGGMLSAWLRQKYPNIVCGALAASAPVAQFTNLTSCGAYFEKISYAYNRSSWSDGSHCVSNLRASWSALKRVSARQGGLDLLTDRFHLCNPLTDVQNLNNYLSDMYGNLAMCNYPYPAQFLADLPAWPVREFCRPLAGLAFSDDVALINALTEGLQVFTNYSRQVPCLDLNGGASPKSLDDKGWAVQTCVDMVMPMCSDGINDFYYPSQWDYDAYSAYCRQSFGFQPRRYWAEQHFWGRRVSAASNIIWSNGALDPWSAGGVLPQGKIVEFAKGLVGSQPCRNCLSLLLDDGAHHLDLRGTDPLDPFALTVMRSIEYKYIVQWIAEWQSLRV